LASTHAHFRINRNFAKNFNNFIFFCSRRPTFKTLTPTSRTQLKQQLQREQLLQDAERKEAEKKALEQKKRDEESKVPLQSIGVDVPPQILQVKLSKCQKHVNSVIDFR
jgi:hypothetical protein